MKLANCQESLSFALILSIVNSLQASLDTTSTSFGQEMKCHSNTQWVHELGMK